MKNCKHKAPPNGGALCFLSTYRVTVKNYEQLTVEGVAIRTGGPFFVYMLVVMSY